MILLFLFVWREKGIFPFANSQQSGFFGSENQGFDRFTDSGLKFSFHFLDGETVFCLGRGARCLEEMDRMGDGKCPVHRR